MSANVRSLDAIDAVKGSLIRFGDSVDRATAALDAEIRRWVDWFEHDCPRYWKLQVHQANDEVAQARAALHRCLMFPINDERPSCREERAALKRAQARLAYCEEKVERVKRWKAEIRRELCEYEGRMTHLAEVAEIDVRHTIGVLTKLLRRLEEYQRVRTNASSVALDVESVAREVIDEEQT